MAWFRKKEEDGLLYLSPARIVPNPNQPRQVFDPRGLEELAASIREHGILQPLTVRRVGEDYELVAGERRLRAAALAGLEKVPCLVVRVEEETSSLLALVENLQRRDLDFVEEAQALSRLIRTYGLSQEEAARRIGKSQSAVANKLRLLRLPPQAVELLREHRLSERHARALLRLDGPQAQLDALRYIIDHDLTVARTEAYIEGLLAGKAQEPPRRPTYIIKDVRLFLNTITRGLELVRSAGVDACCQRRDEGDAILLTIRLPKGRERPAPRPGAEEDRSAG